MIGFLVKCEKCGTDEPNVLYYVGEDSTHCVDCWTVILKAIPDFNLDAMVENINSKFEPTTNTGSVC